LLSESPLTAA